MAATSSASQSRQLLHISTVSSRAGSSSTFPCFLRFLILYVFLYCTMNQEIFCLSKRLFIVPPPLWPFPSCSSAYVPVPLDIYYDTLPFAALVTYLLTKNSVSEWQSVTSFTLLKSALSRGRSWKFTLKFKKNAVDNRTMSLYFMSQLFHPTTSPGPIDMYRQNFDYFLNIREVICVRYHCGGWSEEVNSCIWILSYMVYL
jgi:hypothetical protein